MEVVTKIKNFFNSNLGKQIVFYALFSMTLWALHLIIISLTSFFHFLLDHNIRTIGYWIADRGWQIIILTKLILFYLATLFINIKLSKAYSIRSFFQNNRQKMRMETSVILVFMFLAVISAGNVVFNKTMIVAPFRLIFSLFGTFVFFAVDYIMILILDIFYPTKTQVARIVRLILFPLCFYFFTKITFVYEQTISFKLYAFFLLLMYLGEWKRVNWTIPFYFLICFIVPLNSLMGLDPVWGEVYSPLVSKMPHSSSLIFVLVVVSILYLEYKDKTKQEYIYRD